jgi:hypothetical protein
MNSPARNTWPFVARKAAALLVVLAAWLTVGAGVCRAQTRLANVTDYRARVVRAVTLLEELAQLDKSMEVPSPSQRGRRDSGDDYYVADQRARLLRQVRAALPPTERIARAGGASVEVDNRWLHAELSQYERQIVSISTRVETLRGIAARLAALAERLRELGEVALSGRDKEAEKGRLATILSNPEYTEKRSRESALSRILEEISKWIRGLLPSWRPLQPGSGGAFSTIAQILIYALVALVIGFVFRRYWRRRGERMKVTGRDGSRVVLGEQLAADQTAADLLVEAERLAQGGNLRGAIRKAYIALLCELGDRRVLSLARHKTNRDYLHAVRQFAPQLHTLFQPLTHGFERHWYGHVDASEDDWRNFRANCGQLLSAK